MSDVKEVVEDVVKVVEDVAEIAADVKADEAGSPPADVPEGTPTVGGPATHSAYLGHAHEAPVKGKDFE